MAETGHARNLQHFQEAITFASTWGASYQPTNVALTVANMQSLLDDCQAAMTTVLNSRTAWVGAVNDRETAFEGIRPLITRCVQFYESTGTDQNKVDDVRSLKRKLDGKRAETKDVPPPGEGSETQDNTVSSSQQSYTQIVEHLSGIIDLFAADTLYKPNETELQIATLTTRRDDMKDKNLAVPAAFAPLSNARGARNALMYADDTGLVDIAQLFKKYVRAAYGSDSTQFNQVKGLEFTRPKKD